MHRVAERLLRPSFLALVIALTVFAMVGGVAQQLPFVPATAVTLGAVLLAASLAGRERIAEIGFWALTAGWVALGALPWAHE